MAIVDPVIFTQTNNNTPAKQEHRLEKVVTGEVTVRKKPLNRMLADVFLAEDWDTVKRYILWDVVIPGMKHTFVNAIEMMVLGEVKGGTRTDYTSFGSRNTPKNNRRDFTNNHRSKPDYRDYTFQARRDAEEVLGSLRELVSEYGSASIADFYDAVGLSTEYTENKYGWTNLDRACVRTCADGYFLDMPKAMLIG